MAKLHEVLQDIGFGRIIVVVQNAKIVCVPEQEVEYPGKLDGIVHKVKISKTIEIDQ